LHRGCDAGEGRVGINSVVVRHVLYSVIETTFASDISNNSKAGLIKCADLLVVGAWVGSLGCVVPLQSSTIDSSNQDMIIATASYKGLQCHDPLCELGLSCEYCARSKYTHRFRLRHGANLRR
jgi:hypothetical protein